MANSSGVHLLVYPYPGASHIIPFLDLTHRLLNRGLRVTVLVTPDDLHLLDQLLSRHASSSLQPLVLPAPDPPTKPGLVPGMRALRERHYPLLLEWFHSGAHHASPPVAIISDFFLGWTLSLASQLGLPRLVFSPSSSFYISLNISMCRQPPRIHDPEDVDHLVPFPGLPSSPVFPCHEITWIYRYLKDGDPEKEFYRDNWFDNLKSWGIVVNTCSHLESIYIDYMKKEMAHDRVWAVGPLMLPNEDANGNDADAMDLTNHGGSSELMAWLHACQDDSVVYVSFGSHQVLNSKQTDELAAGLEKSGVNFVWSVREPRDGQVGGNHGVIPVGFEDRVAGKGILIKGWAPQVAILKHRAVGVFLTHCGWNSTLEGVAAGVVMLTWPMVADQFFNAKLLVDQWGIGIRVGASTQNIPDSSELARVLVESLNASRPEKGRAKKLSEASLAALKGGSSQKDLGSFVKTVSQRLGKLV